MKQSIFRNIRRKLLNEGKLVRYITYAIGEVVLIIVGILFALKINDWNEDQKAQVEFDEYVSRLKADVGSALALARVRIESSNNAIERIGEINSLLQINDPNDREKIRFNRGLLSLPQSSYSGLRVGLLGRLLDGDNQVISFDKELAIEALDFETRIEQILHIMENQNNHLNEYVPQLTSFFGPGHISDRIPSTYQWEVIRDSQRFSYIIRAIETAKRTQRRWYERLIKELEDFLTVLEEYDTP